jgi:salicylate hydroxylase
MSARIIIIGAGLGGLTAAIALRQAGYVVEVHEAAPRLGEVGAGLTLSRGAQHVFRKLGIQDQVAGIATPSTNFPFLHYRTGRVLTGKLNNGEGLPDDGTADVSRQCHRADLHAILVRSFEGPLHLDHALVGLDHSGRTVRARFANGDHVEGDALIGADGVRSATRTLLWGNEAPRFTGQIAYRFLVKRARAAPFLEHGRGAVYLGPSRTFNRYTLRSGELLNCVGLAATDGWAEEGWSTPATREEVLSTFDGWHPSVTGLIGEAQHLIKWGIFDRQPLPRWSSGRVTLLGDAAHAMLPFLGLGAAMAIEDAMVLARAFAAEGHAERAFARYEAARLPRTSLVHAKSVQQGHLVQARDPDAYDGGEAPAADPAIFGFNPVTAAL